MNNIIQYQQPQQDRIYTLDEIAKRIGRRRRRVALRMAKRFPLFAIEFMTDEFSDYNKDQFELDIIRKQKPKKRKGKSQLKRQGRYELYEKAMSNYRLTKDQEYLYQAQKIRDRLYKPYTICYKLNGEERIWTYPSTIHYKLIIELTRIQWTSWEELKAKIKKKTRYINY